MIPREEGMTTSETRGPQIGPYRAGNLAAALSLGLAPREAPAWFGINEREIEQLAREDQTFAAKSADAVRLAQLHPLLRLVLAGEESWLAADWLHQFLLRRPGEAPPEDLMALLSAIFQTIHGPLYKSELDTSDWDRRYPIGERKPSPK
jgi:hypothetical protein